MFKLKSNKVLTNNLSLSKNTIYAGIIKGNEENLPKKIIYTEKDGIATDVFDNSIQLPTDKSTDSTFIQKALKVNTILEYLNYPDELTKHQLNKMKKIFCNEKSHVIDKLYEEVDSKNMDELHRDIFHAKYYRLMYRKVKY